MAAKKFFLPFKVAAKPTGVGAPGAKAWFYVRGTSTLRPVYATPALTTTRSNPVVADGAGQFPDFYLDDALTYDMKITDKLGAELYPKQTYIPGTAPDAASLEPYSSAAASSATSSATSAAAAAASATASAASATAAANSATAANASVDAAEAVLVDIGEAVTAAELDGVVIDAPSIAVLAGMSTEFPVYLSQTGRKGFFIFNGGNLAAEVDSDPEQGVYVAPTGDATGASGAWVRSYSGAVDVRWFGALGDGSTDDYAAFQGAIDFLGYRGGSIDIPAAPIFYRLSARLVITAGIKFHGEGTPRRDTIYGAASVSFPDYFHGSTLIWDEGVAGMLFTSTSDPMTPAAFAAATNSVKYKYAGAGGSMIEGLRLVSANLKAEHADAIGVQAHSSIGIRDTHVFGFGDNGIELIGTDGELSTLMWGNVIGSHLENVYIVQNAGSGLAVGGSNANSMYFVNVRSQDNALYGFDDDGQIGNTYVMCLAEGNDTGKFKKRRESAVNTYIGCHLEPDAGECELAGSDTIIGGTMTDSVYHPEDSTTFILDRGIATRAPFVYSNSRGLQPFNSKLGGNDSGMTALSWGLTGATTDWRLQYSPADGAGGSDQSWGFRYGNIENAISIRFPDGVNRSGRDYAAEFPRGICIGDALFSGTNAKVLLTRDEAPTTGAWVVGDMVLNRSPSAGEPIGWRCTTAGTPGTWEALVGGQAAAQANSTATTVADLKTDFNALLAKLRSAGVMAT